MIVYSAYTVLFTFIYSIYIISDSHINILTLQYTEQISYL